MKSFWRPVLAAVAVVGLGSAVSAQQVPQDVPDGPFKTVHLMIVSPAQEPALIAAVKDYDREFIKQGCASCAYHVFKMFTGTRDKYNYMMTSDWPSQDTYIKIHNSAEYGAVTQRNPVMGEVYQDEFYGRYTEVK
jgi:hypothetical protein